MIERYTLKEMKALWSDENRLKAWLDVELAAMKAMEEQEIVPHGTEKSIRLKVKVDIVRMLEIEEKTHHDVVAFISMITEQLGDEGRYLHYGLTSSDVVDTALCILIRDALKLITADFVNLAATIKDQAYKYKDLIMAGRTHGVHAEPTTFGMKLALWFSEVKRDIERLRRAEETISVGKFSGPVGTFSHLDPSIEACACEILGLKPAAISSQIIQRDRHAEVICAMAICAGSLEKFATEIRHLQRTEVREAEEPFAGSQAGSSSMPHKRNPVKCENVTGLARLVKSYAQSALDNIPLWHERDISHSSVERVIFPDAFSLLDFIARRFNSILKDLLVYPEAMERNFNLTKGLIFSGTVLLALVESGMSREDAYDTVRRCSMKVWETGEDFKTLLSSEKAVLKNLGKKGLEDSFSTSRLLANVDNIFRRVFNE